MTRKLRIMILKKLIAYYEYQVKSISNELCYNKNLDNVEVMIMTHELDQFDKKARVLNEVLTDVKISKYVGR